MTGVAGRARAAADAGGGVHASVRRVNTAGAGAAPAPGGDHTARAPTAMQTAAAADAAACTAVRNERKLAEPASEPRTPERHHHNKQA
jgi:hypothetical protein